VSLSGSNSSVEAKRLALLSERYYGCHVLILTQAGSDDVDASADLVVEIASPREQPPQICPARAPAKDHHRASLDASFYQQPSTQRSFSSSSQPRGSPAQHAHATDHGHAAKSRPQLRPNAQSTGAFASHDCDSMASIVYEGVGGGGDLFRGMKFFLLQRIPSRDRWKALVTVCSLT
jgi:hypothetical protein